MIPRTSPLNRIFEVSPFIKSPATAHFRSIWAILDIDGTLVFVMGRQIIRPPWDSEAKRSNEICSANEWYDDYDLEGCAIASNRDLHALFSLADTFVQDAAKRYIHEMLVVASRVKTEDEPIGMVDDAKLRSVMDERALEHFTETASDVLRKRDAMGVPR